MCILPALSPPFPPQQSGSHGFAQVCTCVCVVCYRTTGQLSGKAPLRTPDNYVIFLHPLKAFQVIQLCWFDSFPFTTRHISETYTVLQLTLIPTNRGTHCILQDPVPAREEMGATDHSNGGKENRLLSRAGSKPLYFQDLVYRNTKESLTCSKMVREETSSLSKLTHTSSSSHPRWPAFPAVVSPGDIITSLCAHLHTSV